MKDIALTKAEYAALGAVDGTRTQPEMTPALEARLSLLRLTERREWPTDRFGVPPWATAIFGADES
jgi:hypothetical protein